MATDSAAASICVNLKARYFEQNSFDAIERDILILNRMQHGNNITLDRLHRNGKIGIPELLAAERWERDYARAFGGVGASRDFEQSSRGGDRCNPSDAVLLATERCRIVRAAISCEAEARLKAVLIDGCTLKNLARFMRMSKERSTAKFVNDLQRLSEIYSSDGKK